VGHGYPDTRHEKIMALGRAERVERGIRKAFRSRTELRLRCEERNFEFNAGGEGKRTKLSYASGSPLVMKFGVFQVK